MKSNYDTEDDAQVLAVGKELHKLNMLRLEKSGSFCVCFI